MTDFPPEILVQLKPLAPLHLGDVGEIGQSADRIHSDTLWSALFVVAIESGSDALASVLSDSGFRVSSSFPIWVDTYFYPRPFLRVEGSGDPSERKKWKNVRFVSDGIMGKLIGGDGHNGFSFNETKLLRDGCLLLKSEIEETLKPQWLQGMGTTTANVVDRLTSMTDLFDRTDLHVNTGAGVRLGIRVRVPDAARADFEKALVELGRRGIGGERSTGKGVFEVAEISDFTSPELSARGACITLSLYHPTPAEVQGGILDAASYDIVTRGGWVDRHGVQKKRLRMLVEGSVIECGNGSNLGDIVDVRPEGFPKPVFRYGRAYPLFLEGS